MLNGINKCGLPKHQNVKIQNFPGGTTEAILDKAETLVAEKLDCIIIHAGTNDIMNGINSLNSVKEIVKKVKQTSPNTKTAFTSLITTKDKNNLDKKVQDENNRLKNYCSQTNIEYIENNNIEEENLGEKKLHLKKRGNTIFSNNLLKFLRSNFWDVEFLNCFVESEEYKSDWLDISSDDPSFSSLNSVWWKIYVESCLLIWI